MPARGTRCKPAGKRRSQPKPKMTRFTIAPQLTRTEIRHLRERAAADLRSIGNYVGFLVIRDLWNGAPDSGRIGRGSAPSGRRESYAIRLMLTADQKAELKTRARDHVRSVSS